MHTYPTFRDFLTMASWLSEAETDEDKQKQSLFWGFDPITEFDSGNPNEQMGANSSKPEKKQRSALESSKHPAKSSQSSPLPALDVPSAIYPQEPMTWATRSTDRLGTENGIKEGKFWGFDPVSRSSTNPSMKERCCEGVSPSCQKVL